MWISYHAYQSAVGKRLARCQGAEQTARRSATKLKVKPMGKFKPFLVTAVVVVVTLYLIQRIIAVRTFVYGS